MESSRLQDRIYYGLGAAARRMGDRTDAFRQNGPHNPLSTSNRYLRMKAAFIPMDGGAARANAYGIALWKAVLDGSYTKPGDYLLQEERTFFVAAQQSLLPILCVQTNRVVSMARPGIQTSVASNPYGGHTADDVCALMTGWPASVTAVSGKGQPSADLPTDQVVPYLEILMPAAPGVTLSPGDLVSDDLGRRAVLVGTELSNLGWRLSAKLATT